MGLKNIFISSPPSDKKKTHPAGRKKVFLLNFNFKTQFFEALVEFKKDVLFCINLFTFDFTLCPGQNVFTETTSTTPTFFYTNRTRNKI